MAVALIASTKGTTPKKEAARAHSLRQFALWFFSRTRKKRQTLAGNISHATRRPAPWGEQRGGPE
ncbi:MAG: hypothetical protein WAO58_00750 [Fimbriimonadaceae bacterium]